jgi:hypothetical protein
MDRQLHLLIFIIELRDGQTITSPDVYNRIALCKRLFELTAFTFGLSQPD